MNSKANHEATLREIIREGRAIIVAGTGISIAATFDPATKQPHPQASWTGLLEDGLNWLKDHKLIDDVIASAQLALLRKNPQTHRFISAAEDVTAGMGGMNSPHFADWLKRTIGSITAHDRSILNALDAIRQQGHILATTNYDGLLLSSHLQLEPVTWLETNALIGVIRSWDIGKIIFLHGYWRRPESVILDWKSYDKIVRDEQYREDLAAFWKTNIWVYVGCGVNGLSDPDFGLLLERYGERARDAQHWDYCLVREDQRDEFQTYFDTKKYNIHAISFGKQHADLPLFLHSLLPVPVPPTPSLPLIALPTTADPKNTLRAAKIRSNYLKEARRDFEARLASSIHHARFIDLGIEDNPAAIKPAWGYQNPDTKRSYNTVVEAFNECDRRLLILGSPGSGKTTALLHLAQLLVNEAEKNPDSPIPFVINLSKFRLDRPSSAQSWHGSNKWHGTTDVRKEDNNLNTKFEDWLTSEMAAFPGLGHELAREWIHHGHVAILLDGLDEFNDERRADLVRLLNSTFLSHYPDLIIVVCSRINEYLVLQSSKATRLELRGCVQLQPLNDTQIATYLEAAQAKTLLNALPNDPALRELAQTPLTLSMLVLAYGGLAPNDLPQSGSLSESRHHLFESYVARMLQRSERRKRNIPFDNSKLNDIPTSEYRYRPDQVHRWLGWLALVLSVRMRTSFSLANFHSILTIGVKPDRQLFNFVAVYFAMGTLMTVSLFLMALPIITFTPESLLSATGIGILLYFLLPLAASGKNDWIGTQWFLLITILLVILLDSTILAHFLSIILPGGISPLPISVILPFGVFFALFLANDGFDDSIIWQKFNLWFIGVVALVIVFQFLPENWHLPFFDKAWWQATVAGIVLSLGGSIALVENKSVKDKAIAFGSMITITAFFVLTAWWVQELNWIIGFIALGASLMLILAVAEAPVAINLLLGYSIFAVIGGIAANYQGAIFNAAFFGLLCMIFLGAKNTVSRRNQQKITDRMIHRLKMDAASQENQRKDGVSWENLLPAMETKSPKSLLEKYSMEEWGIRAQIFATSTFSMIERMMLSPSLWHLVAIGQRFALRHNSFITFCKEAFLLKQSSQEYEFVHRLLRDYFALRELRPSLSASDKSHRLNAIRFLGYQGEAALDVLTEFAEDKDPLVRAAALTGLGHISSPIVARYLELHINDLNPLVRQAILPEIFKLARQDRERLSSRLQPVGDSCELDPLLYCLRENTIRDEEIIYNLIKRLLGKTAIGPLKDRVRSKDARLRMIAAGALAQFFGDMEQKLLSVDIDGRSQWLDPAKPITKKRVVQCATFLKITDEEVLARYRVIADDFGLTIKT